MGRLIPSRSTLSLKMWRQLSRWRLNLAGVVVICGAIAMMAVMLGRAHPPPPPPQTRIAQDLGSRGAQEWIDLEHRYRTRYSRNAEEWAIRDFFQDKRGGIFVDVGSNDPRTENNTYFLEATLGWSGVAIDAMQEFAPEYARYRPRTHFFGLFVSDVSNVAEDFYIPTLWPLGASDKRAYAERDGGPVEVRKVRTITLNDLLAGERLDHVDFVSMDIELAEPRALAGFDVERYHPTLVCVEAHPQVRQAILDYFHRHHYVVVGKYMGVDTQNLYFMPASSS